MEQLKVQALISKGIEEALYGAKDLARLCFEKALKYDPQNEEAATWEAFLCEKGPTAVLAWKRVLLINPSNHTAKRELEKTVSRLALVDQTKVTAVSREDLKAPPIGVSPVAQIAAAASPASYPAFTPPSLKREENTQIQGVNTSISNSSKMSYGTQTQHMLEEIHKSAGIGDNAEVMKPHLLGYLLIGSKFIKQEELDQALEYQKRLIQKGSWKQVGQILIELKYLTAHQLNYTIGQQRKLTNSFLGNYLLEKKIIDELQLAKTLFYQNELIKRGKPVLFGRALLEMGFIKEEELDMVLAAFKASRKNSLGATDLLDGSASFKLYNNDKNSLGEDSPFAPTNKNGLPLNALVLQRGGFVSDEQLDEGLRKQALLLKVGDKKTLEMIMVELGYVTQSQIETVIKLIEEEEEGIKNNLWI